ncbi:MAG: glycosyltransferase family 1 protein [Clostridia bacterium]|nr:glycosyltransferase family 1 protein [Clostridia bacterium]
MSDKTVKKTKKLLCLLSGMNAGGAETFLMKIYRQIDKDKYQMDFCINVKEKCFYEDEICAMGGRIFRIPPKSESVKEFKKQLAEIVRDNGYEYVFRITSSAMGFMDLKVAKKAGAKVCAARSSNSSDGGGIKAFIAHRLGRALYGKYLDVKIAPSNLAAKYTFGNKAVKYNKVSILHNAVDLNIFNFDKEERQRIRKEFEIGDKEILVGHVGRFMRQKNHKFLIRVFKEICNRNPNAKLMLVGVGELEKDIKEQVKQLGLDEKVIFTGVRSDVPKLLSAMDVFVFPSFYEGMPNTVIEAQATGLPCVVADTITREANITGLVKYLPLDNIDNWAKETLESIKQGRTDTKSDFIKNGYDIESVVQKFTRLVFGEK